MYPTDRKYSKEHEWIQLEGDTATVGITDFAQRELGDIVFVELPEKGSQVDSGETIGTIESVKAVSEIFAPASGTIVDVNESLNDTPDAVNRAPHGNGWFCKLQLSNPSQLDGLMDAGAYEQLIAT